MISRSSRRTRAVPAALLLTVLLVLLAGCGSSSSGGSSITVGAEPATQASVDSAGASAPTTAATQTATSSTPTVATPTSGPLSKEPKVTAPSGAEPTKLVVKDLITGSGAAAASGRTVTVNYVGVLFHGGKVFDASWQHPPPFSFALGGGQVIPGWDQGVVGMKVGGRRELIIPSKLAYGPQGRPPTIPPNAPLVFVIDLLGA